MPLLLFDLGQFSGILSSAMFAKASGLCYKVGTQTVQPKFPRPRPHQRHAWLLVGLVLGQNKNLQKRCA